MLCEQRLRVYGINAAEQTHGADAPVVACIMSASRCGSAQTLGRRHPRQNGFASDGIREATDVGCVLA
jgi:hypothetical protein